MGRAGLDAGERVRRWRDAGLAATCDRIEPWEHGRVARSDRYPTYYDYNTVLVEDEPGMSAAELMTFADEALDGLEHRRVDFHHVAAGDARRADFEAAGWEATRLLWMRFEGPLPPGRDVPVEEVPYDAVDDLRRTWNEEDFPDQDLAAYRVAAREVALAAGARVLAFREGGASVGFAQIEGDDAASEVTRIFVHPEYRGGGRGTALTRAAITAAEGIEDLWITADDEDRPKELYARLGFRPAWTSIEFARMPG